MIGIVDYGMGNLGSVVNACAFLNLHAEIIDTPGRMDACTGIIVPGQGAFGDCMSNLNGSGFSPALKNWIAEGRPFFGICIGLQVLFEGSQESPGVEGLGVLPGVLQKFEPHPERKVPEMGWNRVLQDHQPGLLFDGIPDRSFFYFVHSFYVPDHGEDWVCGRTEYGLNYVSAVHRDNLFAVQFHPEKSQQVGIRMLRNFGVWMHDRAVKA